MTSEAEVTKMTFAEFQATRRSMSAQEYGELIGDKFWEDDPEAKYLVYADHWNIELCDDGRYLLILGNQQRITGDGMTLEDLEKILYEYAEDELKG